MLGPPDPLVADRIRPLIERGRQRLREYHATFEFIDRPIGGETLNCIEEGDFMANVALCLRHVAVNGVTLYILSPSGKPLVLATPWRST